MKRILTYNIPDSYTGKTISNFLSDQGFTNQSLKILRQHPEWVLLNEIPAFLNIPLNCVEPNSEPEKKCTAELANESEVDFILTPINTKKVSKQKNDTLKILVIETESSKKIPPVPLPFPIVYEDEDIIVLNKPSNMPIHPSLNNYENTLGNAAAYYFSQKNEPFIFRCINRLDRDTTGLTILAKHYISCGILYDAMANREIKRTYTAICEGENIDDEGTIDMPIGRKPGSTIERMVDFEQGEKAITHYKVLEKKNGLSLVKLQLETGRTHQIRVHMKAIGHPLIGDFLYNPNNHLMERQALHAGSISFVHPITREILNFDIPIPEDMKKAF